MLALANLYLRKEDFEACQQQCVALMRADPGNEAAAMMLADLLFKKKVACCDNSIMFNKTTNNCIMLFSVMCYFCVFY